LQESTALSRQALSQGLIDVVMDSQPRQTANALVQLLVELQSAEGFDPGRHRVHIAPQIVTSENMCT
jgi:LacI family transcriptional regulator